MRFSVMTYNVHSCRGTDRHVSPARIANVIAEHAPDVVGLQELDVHRARSGNLDQAHAIAERLAMKFHFHPAIEVAEEKYGDAILSRHPMQLVHAGILPTVRARRHLQRRGALWVTVAINGCQLQVINTHLGLNSRERVEQVRALLGSEWLGRVNGAAPVVLCGDFNAVPGSPAYRLLHRALRESQRCVPGRRRFRTYPTRYPMLRLDHVFVSRTIRVTRVSVLRSSLSRIASDHYPLLAELELDETNPPTGS